MVIQVMRYTVNSWGAPGYEIEDVNDKIIGLERTGILLEDVGRYEMQLMWPKWLEICGARIETIKKYSELMELEFECPGECLNPISAVHILAGDYVMELQIDSVNYMGTRRNNYGRVEKVDVTKLKYAGSKIYRGAQKYSALLKSIYGDYPEEEVLTDDFVKMVLGDVEEI